MHTAVKFISSLHGLWVSGEVLCHVSRILCLKQTAAIVECHIGTSTGYIISLTVASCYTSDNNDLCRPVVVNRFVLLV